MSRAIVFASFLALCPGVWGDVFIPTAEGDARVRSVAEHDPSGVLLRTPGLVWRRSERNAAATGVSRAEAGIPRERELGDVSRSLRVFFDESFRNDPSFDRYKAVRNNLLLLEYSSPALADVVKHYRSMASERVALEYARLAVIEQGAEGVQDRLQRAAERACLHRNQELGIVKAMEACLSRGDPLDGLPLPGGDMLSDGRRAVHVVREAVNSLGLDEKKAGADAAAWAGDVVVHDDRLESVSPSLTVEVRAQQLRGKYESRWSSILARAASGEEPAPASLGFVSLPGVPVSGEAVRALLLLAPGQRDVFALKMSGLAALAEAQRERDAALIFLERAEQQPSLAEGFRDIIRRQREFLMRATERMWAGDPAEELKGLLFALWREADYRRQALLPLPETYSGGPVDGEVFSGPKSARDGS